MTNDRDYGDLSYKNSGFGIRDGVTPYKTFDLYSSYGIYPPGKAMNIVEVRICFDNNYQTVAVNNLDQEVAFTLNLSQGVQDLQTWFITEEGEEFGACLLRLHK